MQGREKARGSRKTKWETKGDGERGRYRWEKEGRKGGKALFRQPDNLPSPEHIYGWPLTPSSCSLWRQSQWCWPACRFPIISLAEGSCQPIHQQVWKCRLSWPSINSYQHYHATMTQRIKHYTLIYNADLIYMFTWSITCHIWVYQLLQGFSIILFYFCSLGSSISIAVLRRLIRVYCMGMLWEE